MRCPQCGYDVRGLPGATCPECGSAFDPDSIGDERDPQISRSIVWFSAVSLGWPLVIQVWAHLTLVVARIELGRWPHRWGMDDPKDIPVVSAMLLAMVVAFLASVPLLIAGLVGIAYGLAYRRRLTVWLIVAVFASWIMTWLIGDRAVVWVWIMD